MRIKDKVGIETRHPGHFSECCQRWIILVLQVKINKYKIEQIKQSERGETTHYMLGQVSSYCEINRPSHSQSKNINTYMYIYIYIVFYLLNVIVSICLHLNLSQGSDHQTTCVPVSLVTIRLFTLARNTHMLLCACNDYDQGMRSQHVVPFTNHSD